VLSEADRSRLASTRFTDVRWFAEIGSTNDWLLAAARDGAPEGMVAVADHQTSGRGRRDRTWVAPPGSSLLVSILLRPDLPPDRLQLVTAAVALAARSACSRVAGVTPDLKWPNDLIVETRKLGGILAESLVSAHSIAVVVGLGLNVEWPDERPSGISEVAVSLADIAKRSVPRGALLTELLAGLHQRMTDWNAVAADYRTACTTVGQRVRVELPDETFEAHATRLLDDGRLEIAPLSGGECRLISAADIVHLRPAR
jgi:BirA family transcriptional regulator, biotin operon repressor / biotin---[acetyl-CoA-carboxylase] ligase